MLNKEEIILNRKTPSYLVSYITILVLTLILVLNFTFLYKYSDNYKTIGIVNGGILKVNVKEELIPNINELSINNKKQTYKIIEISKDYILDEKLNKYKEIVIETKINQKDNINNNVLEVNLISSKKTLAARIIEKIKKG